MSKSLLLIISGSIAAYKALDVIRRLRERSLRVTCVLTRGGAKFVTPLSVAALSGNPVYEDLFSLKDEAEMGHIRLAREHDLIAVVPASADRLAAMAQGRADDLAGAVLLASDKPVLVAPAMNVQMWHHPATQHNLSLLRERGVQMVEPGEGMLACGEQGQGRLAAVEDIVEAIASRLLGAQPLKGRKALVTSGPTQEPIDPVRYIGNRSSGKQGHAIAAALAEAGAEVTLVSGPVALPDPQGVKTVYVNTAAEMLAACEQALPADIAVFCAAVADWRAAKTYDAKLKKRANQSPPAIELATNPDILRSIAQGKRRPALVVGFAAETEKLREHARAKRLAKGADWIVANDVSGGAVFGADQTGAWLLTASGEEEWANISKDELAARLTAKIIDHFKERPDGKRTSGRAAARR